MYAEKWNAAFILELSEPTGKMIDPTTYNRRPLKCFRSKKEDEGGKGGSRESWEEICSFFSKEEKEFDLYAFTSACSSLRYCVTFCRLYALITFL